MVLWEFMVFIVLLVLFAVLFGRPSLDKFLKKETFTTEVKVKFEPEDSPAITVCALNPKQGTGWKKIIRLEKRFKELEIHCNKSK